MKVAKRLLVCSRKVSDDMERVFPQCAEKRISAGGKERNRVLSAGFPAYPAYEEKKVMVSVKEFVKISGVSERSVRRFLHEDGFPVVRTGIKFLIHGPKALEWLLTSAKAHRFFPTRGDA